MTIGRADRLSLSEARKQARAKLVSVDLGLDPLDDRQRARSAKTVAEVCDLYLAEYAEVHKKRSTVRDDRQRIRDYVLTAWGARRAAGICRDDARLLARQLRERKSLYVANRVMALVSHIWKWAEEEALVPEGTPNPARGVRRYREEARERWASREEIERLKAALREEPSLELRLYFSLMLMLGTRKNELRDIRWEWLDLEAGLLQIPTTKANRPHVLPLPREAVEVLRRLQSRSRGPYVFASAIHDDAAMSVGVIDQAWRRVRKRARCEDLRLHDLRRTVGSRLAQDNCSLHLIGAILNQTTASVTATYARFSNEEPRRALAEHAERLWSGRGVGSIDDLIGGKATPELSDGGAEDAAHSLPLLPDCSPAS